MKRSLALLLCATCFAWGPAPAQEQSFPTRPVKIVVPQNAGGSSDVMVRVLSTRLSQRWGQPVVVENKGGAGGNLGAELVARSAPDGYTLLFGYLATQAVNGALYRNLSYSPEKDFVAVSAVANTPVMVVVNNKVPAATMDGLIELARTKPLNYASSGSGSLNHLMGELINSSTGVKITHVPYKGIAQALTDTIGGQVEILYIGVPAVISQVKAGQVKPIAVTAQTRVEGLKEVPTMAEAGYKDLTFEPWFGLFAPVGTPPGILQKIHADVNEVLRSTEVAKKFEAAGLTPMVLPQDAFARMVREDTMKWGAIVRSSGAKVD